MIGRRLGNIKKIAMKPVAMSDETSRFAGAAKLLKRPMKTGGPGQKSSTGDVMPPVARTGGRLAPTPAPTKPRGGGNIGTSRPLRGQRTK